ncbi:MAG: biosynthetic-type acetolactate synthase large subunit [Thermoguttaceae bacterium]|nr:biosynthetic-type acetolactate synthase large subunit [Thermoguttaceae bacterium]
MTAKKTEANQCNDQESTSPRMLSGADIVIQTLVNCGVDTIFAYPGGYSMPLHQAMTRFRDKVRVVLPRHEQGGGFAAQGYARATGKIGVCMVTSGPGAMNLITSIADAKLDSVPLLAITGQVNTDTIGSDGFQETPTTEVCRSITKHHYLVTDINDLVRTIKEAIFVATTGRPGPVLVDLPKNIQVQQCYPNYEATMNLPGYSDQNHQPSAAELDLIVESIKRSRRPVLFVGGGVVNADASDYLRRIVEKTHIPVTTSMTGLSAFDRNDYRSLGMIGMHGTVCANRAVAECDLLLALGVRFSDRVTGKVSEFAKSARIIQIDVDPSEINKVKKTQVAIACDLADALGALDAALDDHFEPSNLDSWYEKIDQWKKEYPVSYDENSPYILPEHAITELWKATKDLNAIITTGVGQHQMWTTEFYRFSRPRTWISSCGLGTMGFGLPAAIGAKIACPDRLVVDIDGDGSFQMNIQEMATCFTENIPVKVMLLNNQHLGMVMQWEDRFYKKNRANTYLGCVNDPEAFGQGDGVSPKHRFPDYIAVAAGYGWEALSISKKEELPGAIQTMIASTHPFLLDVQVPYFEHVLPMTPPGGTIADMILK